MKKRSRGRPPLSDSTLVRSTLRLPPDLHEWAVAHAAERAEKTNTPSYGLAALVRELLERRRKRSR